MRILASILICLGLLFSSSCGHFTTDQKSARYPSGNESPLHLVFDIDWTLVTPLKQGSHTAFTHSENLFEVNGHYYLLKDGMRELIELAKEKGISVSFFSGGKKSRNVALLKKIKLSNGEDLYSLAHKVLSFEDLTEVNPDPRLRFSERFKKDMSKVHSDIEKVILLEDIPHFGKGQGLRQTAWLGETTFPRLQGKTLEESQNYWKKFDVENKFLPQSLRQDWWEKRKVFLLIKELEAGNRDTQSILDNLMDKGFSENTPPNSIGKYLIESETYKKFLKRGPCPHPLFN